MQGTNLQPLTDEILSGASAIAEDVAMQDIAANGFWGGRFVCANFDVKVFNPHVPSNGQRNLTLTYRKHEMLSVNEQRVREV